MYVNSKYNLYNSILKLKFRNLNQSFQNTYNKENKIHLEFELFNQINEKYMNCNFNKN